MAPNQVINIALCIVFAVVVPRLLSQKILRKNCHNVGTFKAGGTDFMVKDSSSKLNATIITTSLSHCARNCIKTSGCQSLVYKKNPATPTEKNCQIVNVEKSDLANEDKESSNGWIYYEPLQQEISGCPLEKCAKGFQCVKNCTNNSYSCVDIDECQSNPCQNGATCYNLANAYYCSCRSGFNGKHCETKLCQSSWVRKGDYGYLFVNVGQSWPQARRYCLAVGGNLTSVMSSNEYAFISSRIHRPFWIGATDESVEGTFKWLDGTPLTYQNWCPGKPNDAAPNINCLLVKSCGWKDEFCSFPLRFVCKR